jgi:hypothetical protein
LNQDKIRSLQSSYNARNQEAIAAKQTEYNQANQLFIQANQEIYNSNHREEIQIKQRCVRKKLKSEQNQNDRLLNFKKEIRDGPSFICQCCDRRMFKQGVMNLTEKALDAIISKHGEAFLDAVLPEKSSAKILCHNCYTKITHGKKPSIRVSNGLQLDKIPPELQLTDLENQMIAKDLLFIKIKLLPKSRMGAIVDRVIMVPLGDEDIEKTINCLPRMPSKAALLPVRFKRMKSLKNDHMTAFIRPEMVVAGVKKLKQLNNPFYINVKVSETFDQDYQNEMHELDAAAEEQATDQVEEQELIDEQPVDNEELDPIKRYQVEQADHTCMVPEDPSSMVIMNTTNQVMSKKMSRKSAKSFVIAPGESKIPTNWLRSPDFDVKAYPCLHPTGSYGVFYTRAQHVSIQQYFTQRLLNRDLRFARDKSYLFMAQQYVERHYLERLIDVMAQRGKMDASGRVCQVSDACSVFQKIRGTPKFWQQVRYEILSKIEALGPFQIFFTFSCGELRWSEIFVYLFKEKDVTVSYQCDDESGEWNGTDESILINGIPLWEYMEVNSINKNDMLREEVFHVTRMFDNRVKSFIKNVLMSPGMDRIPFSYYSYRVEFQARGMYSIYICVKNAKSQFFNLGVNF